MTSTDPQAQFLWACFRDLFHYTAYHLADIAETARDVDFAIRWGYGWKLGPFETWQAAGWQQVAGWIAEDIAAGKAMSDAPLPAWVTDGRRGVHARRRLVLAGHGRGPAALDAAGLPAPAVPRPDPGREVRPRADGVGERRRAPVDAGRRGIGILSFKTKMNTVNDDVLDGIQQAIARWPRSSSRPW